MLMLVMTLCQGSNLERESKEREDAGSPFNALLAPLLRSADGSTTSHSRNSKLEKVAETSSSTATSTPSTSIGGVSYNKRVYLFLELMLKILREENSGIQTAANYTRREADQGQVVAPLFFGCCSCRRGFHCSCCYHFTSRFLLSMLFSSVVVGQVLPVASAPPDSFHARRIPAKTGG